MARRITRRQALITGLTVAGGAVAIPVLSRSALGAEADLTGIGALVEPGELPWDAAKTIVAETALPMIPAATFDARSFGANGNGSTDNTSAFRRAIDACSAAGGGHVIVPSGTYVTGAIRLKNNVDLHLNSGAVLKFSGDASKSPRLRPRPPQSPPAPGPGTVRSRPPVALTRPGPRCRPGRGCGSPSRLVHRSPGGVRCAPAAGTPPSSRRGCVAWLPSGTHLHRTTQPVATSSDTPRVVCLQEIGFPATPQARDQASRPPAVANVPTNCGTPVRARHVLDPGRGERAGLRPPRIAEFEMGPQLVAGDLDLLHVEVQLLAVQLELFTGQLNLVLDHTELAALELHGLALAARE